MGSYKGAPFGRKTYSPMKKTTLSSEKKVFPLGNAYFLQ
jgi:hypothetical protein